MKETKTVQCYPSDEAVNEMMAVYADFGWELVSNQRCREADGSSENYDYYKTFNKLTFSREKSNIWYDEVSKYENNYHTYEKLYEDTSRPEDVNKKMYVCIVLGPIGWILLAVYLSKTKKALKKWEENDKDNHYKYYKEMSAIREKASKLVNA